MVIKHDQGSNLWSGSGVPSNSIGANGDGYQNIDNSDYYIKTSGSWVLRTTIEVLRSLTFNSPLTNSTGNISINLANTSTPGYISNTDWNTFNSKASTSYVDSNHHDVYYHYPVTGGVVENDIVMNIINNGNGQAPLSFKLAVNGGDSYYPAIYGVAKNVSGGFADIYVGKSTVVPGFSFGAFIGVEYYLDPANPGKLTWTPPTVGSSVNAIKIGRALDATHLILDPIGNFVQLKGGIYTSDGTYDEVLSPGSNGNVLVANSAAGNGYGLQWSPAVVASAPFTYTTATRTLTIATATNSVAGVMSAADHALLHNALTIGTANGLSLSTQALSLAVATDSVPGALSAADHTTYTGYAASIALKAPLASPTFTGDVNASTGNLLVSTIGKTLSVKTGTNAKIGQAVLVAGTKVVTNTSVTANSRIFLTVSAAGGTQGFLRTTKSAGVSFTITSTSATETSTVDWIIVESIP